MDDAKRLARFAKSAVQKSRKTRNQCGAAIPSYATAGSELDYLARPPKQFDRRKSCIARYHAAMARRYRERAPLPFIAGVDYSPASIRAACLAIQEIWRPLERLRRSGALDCDESLRDVQEREPHVYAFGTIDGRIVN